MCVVSSSYQESNSKCNLISASICSVVANWPTACLVQLTLLHVEVVEDAVLCGARFTDARGSKFAVTAYDSHEVLTFIRKATPV